jgi:hypothetical protein
VRNFQIDDYIIIVAWVGANPLLRSIEANDV